MIWTNERAGLLSVGDLAVTRPNTSPGHSVPQAGPDGSTSVSCRSTLHSLTITLVGS